MRVEYNRAEYEKAKEAYQVECKADPILKKLLVGKVLTLLLMPIGLFFPLLGMYVITCLVMFGWTVLNGLAGKRKKQIKDKYLLL